MVHFYETQPGVSPSVYIEHPSSVTGSTLEFHNRQGLHLRGSPLLNNHTDKEVQTSLGCTNKGLVSIGDRIGQGDEMFKLPIKKSS